MVKSIGEGFNTFLGWLVPLDSEHNKSTSHKDSVKSCLEKNFGCYNLFETGSFGNGTGIRHHSDTDYFAVCEAKQLYTGSDYTLRKVKEALQSTFWSTSGIEVNTPAVKIPFGTYASETLEVTPCMFNGLVATPVGSKASYNIPSLDGSWMASSPQAHNAYVEREDKRLGGKLKTLIQLIKAWKFYNNVPINSFYLELRITKYAEGEKAIVYSIDIRNILDFLYKNDLPNIIDPMGISGYVRACSSESKKDDAISKLLTGLTRAEKARHCEDKDIDKCFYWWDLFYNYKFPAR